MEFIRGYLKLIAFSFILIASAHAKAVKMSHYYDYDEYIGYPATWGEPEVGLMFGNSPEANYEMGGFIRVPFYSIY